LEKSSEHPLAEAVVRGAEERNIKLVRVENFESVTGQGLIGQIDGKQSRVGNE
jgi:P-type Cu+ transporter